MATPATDVTDRDGYALPIVPEAERGYVNGEGLIGTPWDADERIPDLQFPNSTRVYYRMEREDSRVTSLLQAIALPIRRTVWRIDPAGASDEVTQFVADNLNLPIVGQDVAEDAENATASRASRRTRGQRRDRFSWSQHLQTALLMLQYGHSYFEQVYRYDENLRKLRLRKLAPRPQRTIAKINVARDGGLHSISQNPPAYDGRVLYAPTEVEIPVNKIVAYVRDPDPGQWIGKSILRPAYRPWLIKDDLLRVQAAAIRRNGMGVPVVTTAHDDPAEVARANEIARSFRAGNTSGVGLPVGWSLELLGVQGNLPDIHLAIEYHDKQIGLAGLAHFLNLDKGGSYALASVQESTFVQSVQTVGEVVCDTANEHIVEDLVELNWGPDELAPLIVFDEIGSRQDATAAAMKMLVDSGLLKPDVLLERTIRQNLGLPSPDPDAVDDEPEPDEQPTPIVVQPAAASGRRAVARQPAGQGALF